MTVISATDVACYQSLDSEEVLRQFQMICRVLADDNWQTENMADLRLIAEAHRDYMRDLLIDRNYTPIYDLMHN